MVFMGWAILIYDKASATMVGWCTDYSDGGLLENYAKVLEDENLYLVDYGIMYPTVVAIRFVPLKDISGPNFL